MVVFVVLLLITVVPMQYITKWRLCMINCYSRSIQIDTKTGEVQVYLGFQTKS